jgi:hypothetical protein
MPKESVCAEIGVDRGNFSERILRVVRPRTLHLIDPWKYESGDTYRAARYGPELAKSQANMDNIYQTVVKNFRSEVETGQVVIHRGSSEEVCGCWEEHYFDWIYVDGNHLYEFVKKDLEIYYHKVKDGGFITGDDYAEGGWFQGGVKRAVDEFITKGLVKVVIIKNRQFILRKERVKPLLSPGDVLH